jgi:hypothetical protein
VLGTDYDGVVIVELPDTVTAEAWEIVINKTGAVKQMDTHELLNEQLILHRTSRWKHPNLVPRRPTVLLESGQRLRRRTCGWRASPMPMQPQRPPAGR